MNYQTNKISGNAYGGQNQVNLQGVKEKNGYKSDAWITFLQARELGLKIKKGSKAVSVFKGFGTATEIKKTKDGKIKSSQTSVPIGFAKVFNLDCTEKFEAKK